MQGLPTALGSQPATEHSVQAGSVVLLSQLNGCGLTLIKFTETWSIPDPLQGIPHCQLSFFHKL